MIAAMKGRWYRWLVDAMILTTVFALGLCSYALYSRFSQSNSRFAEQQGFNYRLDHATDKLTCAFVGIIKTSDGNLDTPGTPEFIALAQLNVSPEKLAQLKRSAHKSNARNLRALPAHAPCR